MTNTINIEIFVNTWKNYNINGAYGGSWLPLPLDPDYLVEFLNKIATELGDDDPEWAIHDVSVDGLDLDISEYDDILELNDLVNELCDLDEYDIEVVAAYIEATGNTLREALDELDDLVYYPGYTLEDVAYEMVNEYYSKGDPFLLRYFDYAALARDLSYDDFCETSTGVICIH